MTAVAHTEPTIDDTDKRIVNALQGGFPLTERPFYAEAGMLGIPEDDLIARLQRLLDAGLLTRFGPLYNIDRMGGSFCLCALAAPADRFDEIAEIVNGFPEVAHNYERDHSLNMWFVLAVERPEDIGTLVEKIEAATGVAVFAFPKEAEYFVEFKVKL
ncbi:MAG: Lrp/AsnC family transcriptional regulator [Hyphomicrobiales bacterium]|nr:Lrp/AsnC family transcriptional regulator [Hyphomicrobiales bacterium]